MLKTPVFAAIILSAVVIASILFIRKFKAQVTPLDEIKSALGSLRATMDSKTTIACMSYTRLPETAGQVANAMVPVSVVPYTALRDTTLFVFKVNAPDSEVVSHLINRTRLWEEHSANYHFVLAGNNHK